MIAVPMAVLFAGALLLAVAGLGGGLLWTRRRKTRPARPLDRRRVRTELEHALDDNDGVVFCRALREAAQAQLAVYLGSEPGSITLADFRWDQPDADICALFEAADAVLYSGRIPSRDEMRDWSERLFAELDRLEAADPLANSVPGPGARVIT